MDRKTKKHEVVVTNKRKQRRSNTEAGKDRDRGGTSSTKKSSRSNTVNISTGIFKHKARHKKRKEQAKQTTTSKRGHSGPQLERKPSATYYDAEEEEKYQRPNTITAGGDGDDDPSG